MPPDASAPCPLAGSEFDLEADTIVAAISQEPRAAGLDITADGAWVQAEGAQVPGMEGVFAGGDAVELGLVTIAIAQGRFAAEAIDAQIQGKPLQKTLRPAAHRRRPYQARLVQAGRTPRA